MRLSEMIEYENWNYCDTLNEIVALEAQRDDLKPCDFKTVGDLYEGLKNCEESLRRLEEEQRRLEEHGDRRTEEEPRSTSAHEQASVGDWQHLLQQARKAFFAALAALEAEARTGTYQDRMKAVQAMRAVAKDFTCWGIVAVGNAAGIEGEIAPRRSIVK